MFAFHSHDDKALCIRHKSYTPTKKNSEVERKYTLHRQSAVTPVYFVKPVMNPFKRSASKDISSLKALWSCK